MWVRDRPQDISDRDWGEGSRDFLKLMYYKNYKVS